MNLGPWAVSDMWRDHLLDRIRTMQAACEGAALAIGEWKDEIVGTTYEGGPCPGVAIVDAYRGGDIPMKSHNRIELKPDPDAAYQDDVRRG